MNKQFLKSIRDNLPDFVKYKTARIFRNELITNKEFCRYFNLLENRKTLSPGKIKDYQFEQLKNVLIHAYKNVPYYRDLFDQVSFNPAGFSDFEQISCIPFLTKDIIRSNFNKLISGKTVKNGYYVGHTGGTSGSPMKFLHDFNSVCIENAFIYYYRTQLGYKFTDTIVTFRQTEYGDKLWKYNPMYNEVLFFPMKFSRLTIADYAKKINECEPIFLNGYLSSIWYFAKLLEEAGIELKFKIKGIFLISENIDKNQRKFIEQFFDARSITFYGHSERCVIAQEVTPSRYTFDPYYGYTEQIPFEENRLLIVGTGFLNYKMPFIRYKTDDVCIPDENFFSIEGKRSSLVGLVGINNEFMPSSVFDSENPVFKNVLSYQFMQNQKGKADILIIPGKFFKSSEIDDIKSELNKQTKGIIEIDVKLVDKLTLTNRGKYQMYISNIN